MKVGPYEIRKPADIVERLRAGWKQEQSRVRSDVR